MGVSRRRSNPSRNMVVITPSTCQGCDEHDGKYFVQDRLSLSRVSDARQNVAVSGQVHDTSVILDYGLRACSDDGTRAVGCAACPSEGLERQSQVA